MAHVLIAARQRFPDRKAPQIASAVSLSEQEHALSARSQADPPSRSFIHSPFGSEGLILRVHSKNLR
jgi:hypothetical protein